MNVLSILSHTKHADTFCFLLYMDFNWNWTQAHGKICSLTFPHIIHITYNITYCILGWVFETTFLTPCLISKTLKHPEIIFQISYDASYTIPSLYHNGFHKQNPLHYTARLLHTVYYTGLCDYNYAMYRTRGDKTGDMRVIRLPSNLLRSTDSF